MQLKLFFRNGTYIIFSQQILSNRLLLIVFKLWIQIRTNNNLSTMICFENVMNVILFFFPRMKKCYEKIL